MACEIEEAIAKIVKETLQAEMANIEEVVKKILEERTKLLVTPKETPGG